MFALSDRGITGHLRGFSRESDGLSDGLIGQRGTAGGNVSGIGRCFRHKAGSGRHPRCPAGFVGVSKLS